jgi:hypothetical protein
MLDPESVEIEVKARYDSMGKIISFELLPDADDELAQAEDFTKNFLNHAGIKGMKWGVRKARKKGSASGKPSWAKPPPKQTVKNLSDKQLKDAVERMRLEKQFEELTAGSQKQSVSLGRRFAVESGKFLADAAIEIGKDQAKKQMAKSVGKTLDDIAFKKTGRSPASALSDKALEKSIKRAKLEKQYRTLY